MKPLRIAILDSGIDGREGDLPALMDVVTLPGICRDGSDESGHGTAILSTIQERIPDAHYFIVKLFGPLLRTTTSSLLTALHWALDNEMDIVNLSLGVPNLDYRPNFEEMVKQANDCNTLLVCAHSDLGNPVLPGCLRGVIPAEVDDRLSRDQFEATQTADGKPYFLASGLPCRQPQPPLARNLKGVSFAVANMTGFVAQACSDLAIRDVCGVIAALRSLSRKTQRFNSPAS